jgi:hypothetical protein
LRFEGSQRKNQSGSSLAHQHLFALNLCSEPLP